MSGLRARLDALRGTASPPAPPRGSLADLRARIERLQTKSARRAAARPARDDEALARELGGEVVEPGLVRVTRRMEPGARHGATHLTAHDLPVALNALGAGEPEAPGAVLFMDTETTGLSGGTGTVVFLLGLARFAGGALALDQYLITRFEGEAAMLRAANEAVEGATHVVSYNGRAFDAPLVATRCKLSGVADPFAPLAHVDLLAPTRRAYRGRWEDCRLATAEQRLLGYTRVNDLPGSEAPGAWFAWIRHGRSAVLGQVLEHNRYDVVSLAALAILLGEVVADPLGYDANIGKDAALFGYLEARRDELPDHGRLYLAHLARQRGEWALAVEQWQRLAERGHLEAFERLAKYHEHVSRDLEQAVLWTRTLLEREPDSSAHAHRAARLEVKRAARESRQAARR